MNNRHRTLVAILVAAVMALALFSAFSITLFHQTPAVVLPTPTATPTADPSAPTPAADYTPSQVDVTTVQQVVATLARPDSYSRTVTAETLENGRTIGAATTAVIVDGGFTRSATTLPDGRVRHSLVGEGKRYLWYDRDKTYEEFEAGDKTADLAQQLPTYEDVLNADPSHITAAGYEESGGLPCVYVEVEEPSLGYLEAYWISVDTGLLIRSESSKDGEVFYRMSGYTVESPATPGQAFNLPDGTTLHTTALTN